MDMDLEFISFVKTSFNYNNTNCFELSTHEGLKMNFENMTSLASFYIKINILNMLWLL